MPWGHSWASRILWQHRHGLPRLYRSSGKACYRNLHAAFSYEPTAPLQLPASPVPCRV